MDTDEILELTDSLWDIDYSSKKIKRKPNVVSTKIPIISLYRLARRQRANDESKRKYDHPFTTSGFKGVLGLSEGWHISPKDRKYLEKDLVLFAEDQKTPLIVPENKRWWETSWFNVLSITLGIIGSIFGVIGVVT